jgi:hypothetical protein
MKILLNTLAVFMVTLTIFPSVSTAGFSKKQHVEKLKAYQAWTKSIFSLVESRFETLNDAQIRNLNIMIQNKDNEFGAHFGTGLNDYMDKFGSFCNTGFYHTAVGIGDLRTHVSNLTSNSSNRVMRKFILEGLETSKASLKNCEKEARK